MSNSSPARRTACALSAWALLAPWHVLAQQPDAQALLAASDAIRNPTQPFKVMVTVLEFEKGRQTDSTTLASYARTLESGGQFATLVRFVEPARDAGKMMLKAGKDLWFYDPTTRSSVRISPQQRLMGQAANGDVLTVMLARDYKAVFAGEEAITDGERKERKSHRLNLTASSEDATYAAVELWIDADNRRPIKGRFLADSGRLLKTVFYRKYQAALGVERPTEMVIIDGLDPQQVTLIRLSDFSLRNTPAAWFQRDYLPRFQGD